MTVNFWKFLFGMHRKSDEGRNKKNIYIYIPGVPKKALTV